MHHIIHPSCLALIGYYWYGSSHMQASYPSIDLPPAAARPPARLRSIAAPPVDCEFD